MIPMRLSIIVPVLDEASQLPDLFEHLRPLQRAGCEIIFSDGGSTDGSVKLAQASGFPVIIAPRGRARQMNAGAAGATGDVLLFLHADTRLPECADHLVIKALTSGEHCWGRFNVRITGRSFMLGVIGRMMNWRSRLGGIATGDQALFVRRDVFEHLKGYPDQPLMEDVELCKRLLRFSRPACITRCVETSGRRWETAGVWRTILLMWWLRWAYWRGVSAIELAKTYR